MKQFIVLLLISAITVVKCCKDDTECSVSNTSCENEKCVCNLGYVLNKEGTKCLPYATEYMGDCQEDIQCEWLGDNSECHIVKCVCQEGYRWYLGQCRKYVGLSENCNVDLDCFDGYNLESLTCKNNVCSCSEGFYQRNGTDCRKISSTIDGLCTLDMDCQVPNTETVCHLGKCQKRLSQLENLITDTEEMEEIGYSFGVSSTVQCIDDANCSDIANSYCYTKTGSCICKSQYFFNSEATACIAELGVPTQCTVDSDCPIKPGKCLNGVCYCRDYYFVSDGNRNCIKSMSETNWNCLSKEWCYALGSYVYCSSNETCSCSKVSNYNEETHLCIWNGQSDPEICTNDLDCSETKNRLCIDEKCACEKNYLEIDGQCIPELDQKCDPTDKIPCATKNSECRDGTCQCLEDYIFFNKQCYESKEHIGDECEVDIQCTSSIVYAECVENQCQCDEDYLASDNQCYKKTSYNGYCNNKQECILSVPDSLKKIIRCRKSKCQCPTGYTLKENQCSSAIFLRGNILTLVSILIIKTVLSVC